MGGTKVSDLDELKDSLGDGDNVGDAIRVADGVGRAVKVPVSVRVGRSRAVFVGGGVLVRDDDLSMDTVRDGERLGDGDQRSFVLLAVRAGVDETVAVVVCERLESAEAESVIVAEADPPERERETRELDADRLCECAHVGE